MKLDFEKMGGLIPAIVQDYNTNKVLMLGFMNEEAYEETKATGKVTFFSRRKHSAGSHHCCRLRQRHTVDQGYSRRSRMPHWR